jgi:1-acyl-sn-glycerol-3-phosphate acyltransferase
MSAKARRFGRTKALAALGASLLLLPPWLLAKPRTRRARDRERRFYSRVARGFLSGVKRSGAAAAGEGTLFVCNHISWLDIAVLGSLLDADFIAKAGVADWPLVGPLSRRTGILLVKRDRRGDTAAQVEQIGAKLRQGRSLVLFPEGTTSDGCAILPFRSSLFAAAAEAARIQPIALCYSRRRGEPLDEDEMRAVGWTGNEMLLPNAARVAGMRLSAEVRMLSPFEPEAGASRKLIADRCREAIEEAYAAMRAGERA